MHCSSQIRLQGLIISVVDFALERVKLRIVKGATSRFVYLEKISLQSLLLLFFMPFFFLTIFFPDIFNNLSSLGRLSCGKSD